MAKNVQNKTKKTGDSSPPPPPPSTGLVTKQPMRTLENSTFCPRGQKITNVLHLQRGNVFMSSSFSSDSSLHHYRATSSMKYIVEKRAASGICHIFSRIECPPPARGGHSRLSFSLASGCPSRDKQRRTGEEEWRTGGRTE